MRSTFVFLRPLLIVLFFSLIGSIIGSFGSSFYPGSVHFPQNGVNPEHHDELLERLRVAIETIRALQFDTARTIASLETQLARTTTKSAHDLNRTLLIGVLVILYLLFCFLFMLFKSREVTKTLRRSISNVSLNASQLQRTLKTVTIPQSQELAERVAQLRDAINNCQESGATAFADFEKEIDSQLETIKSLSDKGSAETLINIKKICTSKLESLELIPFAAGEDFTAIFDSSSLAVGAIGALLVKVFCMLDAAAGDLNTVLVESLLELVKQTAAISDQTKIVLNNETATLQFKTGTQFSVSVENNTISAQEMLKAVDEVISKSMDSQRALSKALTHASNQSV